MDFIELFNPFKYFSEGTYTNFFIYLFKNLFNGWLARVFGFMFLFLAFWFWTKRENIMRGLGFFIMAVIFGYGWVLFRIMGVAK